MKVLWLASWYPSKNDSLTGDFFQRHAQAASTVADVHVLHIKRDDTIANNIEHSFNQEGRLSETIILYKPFLHFIKGLSAVFSMLTWNKLMKQYVQDWIKENGKPDIIHVKAAWKCGLIALWCKTKYDIPYFVSEHYTGYLNEAKGFVPTFNLAEQYFLKKIFKGAAKVLPVSNYMGKCLQNKYHVCFEVLENVINTAIFKPSNNNQHNNTFTLLHVSLLNLQKDPKTLFLACEILVKQGLKFQLVLVSPRGIAEQYLDEFSSVKPFVKLLPETNQIELAKLMQQADLFVFPSLFESFGLVPYEAIACGTPVIVSDIEVLSDRLKNKPYVHFFSVGNPNDLAAKIESLAKSDTKVDEVEMYQFVDANFSEKIIAHRFAELYNCKS